MRHRIAAAAVILAAVIGGGAAYAQTAGPIMTVPGYPGCGGNSTVRTVTADYTCANARTYTIPAGSRTVTAVSTLRPDGTGSVTFTLNAAVPFAVPLRVRSHVGVSSSGVPLTDDRSGQIPAGSTGPVTLSFRYICGQIDVKAVFTNEGDERGRISGGYFCTVPVSSTTTTTTPSTVPDTAPSTAPATTATPSGPGSSGPVPTAGGSSVPASPAGSSTPPAGPLTLPPTGGPSSGDILGWAGLLTGAGVFLLLAYGGRRTGTS